MSDEVAKYDKEFLSWANRRMREMADEAIQQRAEETLQRLSEQLEEEGFY